MSMYEPGQRIRVAVFEALDNAVANGHDFVDHSVKQVIDDLMTCDADLEGARPDDLEPWVREWMHTHG